MHVSLPRFSFYMYFSSPLPRPSSQSAKISKRIWNKGAVDGKGWSNKLICLRRRPTDIQKRAERYSRASETRSRHEIYSDTLLRSEDFRDGCEAIRFLSVNTSINFAERRTGERRSERKTYQNDAGISERAAVIVNLHDYSGSKAGDAKSCSLISLYACCRG